MHGELDIAVPFFDFVGTICIWNQTDNTFGNLKNMQPIY